MRLNDNQPVCGLLQNFKKKTFEIISICRPAKITSGAFLTINVLKTMAEEFSTFELASTHRSWICQRCHASLCDNAAESRISMRKSRSQKLMPRAVIEMLKVWDIFHLENTENHNSASFRG